MFKIISPFILSSILMASTIGNNENNVTKTKTDLNQSNMVQKHQVNDVKKSEENSSKK